MSEEQLEKIRDNIEIQMIYEQNSGYRETYSKPLTEKIELYNEIIRLNNILNELEKWLKEKSVGYKNNTQIYSYDICCQALEKIKELKILSVEEVKYYG